uniref:oligosaccharide flippase family protein n=1 Tax=Candidatus Entotheonella palauensis TaxID=93172 RepID=UPI000B7DE723
AAAGLPKLITREVAKAPERTKHFLYHGYLAALVPSAVAMLVMVIFPWAMGYEPETRRVIILLSSAILPYALSVITEGVIRGREKMHLIAIANIPGNVGMLAAGYYVLSAGYGVPALAAVMVAARLGTLLFAHTLLRRAVGYAQVPVHLSVRDGWRLLRQSWVFLTSESIIIINASMNTLILSKFANESDIALLSASYQILQPVLMIYRNVGDSTLPTLAASRHQGTAMIAHIVSELIRLLLRLGIPAAVAMFIFAEDILGLVYGNPAFRSGAFVLQILTVSLVINLVNPVLGQGLLAMDKEKTILRIVMIDLAITLLIGTLLVAHYGLMGAAVAALITSVANVAQHWWHFRRQVVELRLLAEVVRLVPATLALLSIAALLPLPRLLNVIFGLAVYLKLAGFKLPVKGWRGRDSAAPRSETGSALS